MAAAEFSQSSQFVSMLFGAVLLGQRDRVRVHPPTDDELEAGRDFVRRATAYGDARRIQKAAEQVKPSSTPEPAGEQP